MNDSKWYYSVCILAVIIERCYSPLDPCELDFVVNLYVLVCKESVERIPRPHDYQRNGEIDVLRMPNCPKLIFHDDDWEDYTKILQKLELGKINIPKQNVSLKKFLGMKQLSCLQLQNTELTDDYMFELPQSLTTFLVQSNRYTYLNVSMCPKLFHLDCRKNNLKSLPIFAQPPLAMKWLYIADNPLDNVTVEDIAALCNLEFLNMKFPAGSYLSTEEGFCQCYRLRKFFHQLGLDGQVGGCLKRTKKESLKCELNCSYLQYIRRNCADDHQITGCISPKIEGSSAWIMWTALFGLICMVIIILGVLVYKLAIKKNRHSDEHQQSDLDHSDTVHSDLENSDGEQSHYEYEINDDYEHS